MVATAAGEWRGRQQECFVKQINRPMSVCTAILAAIFLGNVLPAFALINPQFTPVHLVNQSDIILRLKPQSDAPAGKMVFSVEAVLKGTLASKTLEVDTTSGLVADQVRGVEKLAKTSTDKLALMFIAAKSDDKSDENAAAGRKAYLQLNGEWMVLWEEAGGWKLEKTSMEMKSTWNGGSDMLLRQVQYIMDDPDAVVPVRTGVSWSSVVKMGKVAGDIRAMEAVDLKGNGEALLFVATDSGDHLYSCANETPVELTATNHLQSHSKAHAWGDFNGDGRLDLASWDGKKITLLLQGSNGVFQVAEGGLDVAECLGLTALDVAGKPNLLISTSGMPLLWSGNSKEAPRPLVAGEWTGKNLGVASPCLVADFDNDSLPDIIQPLAEGGLFYKGIAGGGFAVPVACEVAGGGSSGACIGDWDADGLLDVFVPTKEGGGKLWQNKGNGHFTNVIKLTGELSYQAKGSQFKACVADLNNDGRQDLVVFVEEGVPMVFFNRGFRAFGASISLDLSRGTLLPEANAGVKSGCVADFTGDGAQDMALVTNDGEIVIVVRAGTGDDQCVRVVQPAAAGAGPVRVCGAIGKLPIGAWNVTAGMPAFLARSGAGPLHVQWTRIGQKEQSKDVVLENKPLTVLVAPAGK